MNERSLERAIRYIDSWLAFRQPRADLPGCVVAVAQRGRLLLNKGYGVANLDTAKPLGPRHVFRVASHSKTFTATALLQLVEQKRCRLDDPLVLHLPWLAEHRDPRFSLVTLAQLLSHGSGVLRDGLEADFWQFERPFPDAGQLRSEVLAARLVLDGDVEMKYSNIGYSLLGMAIEAVSGQSYHDYVREHIIEPLGLSRTGPEERADLAGEMVTGHTRREPGAGRRPLPRLDTRAMAPATGFCSTAEDLCRYFSAHFVGSGQLLADTSKREMQRVQWHVHDPSSKVHQDYGFGLHLETVGARRTIGHGGGFPGQITRSMADPADGLVVVVLTNCIDGPAAVIARGIFALIDFFQQHRPRRAADRLTRFEGRYLDLWAVIDVVAAAGGLAVLSPESWELTGEPDRLEPNRDGTFRIATTSSFGSKGEQVRFIERAGRVVTLDYAGATMWPEAMWPAARGRLIGPAPADSAATDRSGAGRTGRRAAAGRPGPRVIER